MLSHSAGSDSSNIERGENNHTKLLKLNHRKQKKGKKQTTSKINKKVILIQLYQ